MADDPNTTTEPARVAWPLRLLGRRRGAGRGGQGPAAPGPNAPPHGDAAHASSLRGAFRTVGRVALWALIVLLLVRGLGDVVSGGEARVAAPPAQAGQAFPDDAARAFAVGFARVYVESPAPAALRPFLAPEVLEQLTDQEAGRGAPVAQATVTGVRPLAADRAIVTVACQLADQAGRTLHLAVPVARDLAGGVSVVGLPSFVAPPPAGQAGAEELQPLSGSGAEEIRALVQRFVGAYLTDGDPGGLSYLLAPGAGVTPVGGDLRLVEVTDVGQLGTGDATRLTVLAQATARDSASGATYPVAYRLDLVRRDRWYVADVEGALP